MTSRGRHLREAPRRIEVFWYSAGLVLFVLCSALAGLSAEFVHGEGHEERPIAAVVALLIAAGGVYLVCGLVAFRRPPSLGIVLVVALACRAVLIGSTPIQEDDIYRYLWDGKVVAEGVDPYLFRPESILKLDLDARPSDLDARLAELARLRDRTPSNRIILERVNHPDLASIYPPFTQWVFGAAAWTISDEWTVSRQVAALKTVLLVFDLGVLAVVVALLRRLGVPAGRAVLYAWCPLTFKEFANSGHMDAVPIFFVSLSLLAALAAGADPPQRPGRQRGRVWSVLSGASLGIAVASKGFAVLLVPLVARRLGWRRGGLATAAFVGIIALLQLPYREGAAERTETLIHFSLSWENNAAAFLWLEKLARVVTGAARWEFPFHGATRSVEASHLVALLTAGTLVTLITLVVSWKTTPGEDGRLFLRRGIVVLAALLLLGPLGFPWYFVWLVPLFPFTRHVSWFLLPALLSLYYLRFWFSYRFEAAGFESAENAESFFDHVVVTLEFAIFFAAFLGESVARRIFDTSSGTPRR
ncbi:MAG: phospholipid carrier-dependent glycosyltransferase [Planctomycetota bacterium]|nr:phospholipid carrier-dependent glycosyltransferase [Planctomycetota bacterium]